MIKKILIGLIAVVVVLALVGLMLPRHVQVKRSVSIDRPASLVYATVNSFLLFPKWSPWQDLDPNMIQNTEGPRDGVGAKLTWKGNDKVGSGTQLITASTQDRSVSSDLDFGEMGVAKSLMTLSADGKMTTVSWTVDVDMGANPIGHYIGLSMDGMLGKDFAAGLGRLKTLVESMPNTDIAGFSAEPVQLQSVPLLVVSEAAPRDGIAHAYAEGFEQIRNFINKNKLQQTGAPLGIDGPSTAGDYQFEAGIPVDRGDVPGADGIRVMQSYAGKALKSTHAGAYEGLTRTHDQLLAFMAAHAYTAKGPTFTWFVDDPGNTPPETLRTEVYVPVN